MPSCSKMDIYKDNVSNSLRDILTHLNVVLESFRAMLSRLSTGFYSPYLKTVPEMVSTGWQTHVKPNKHSGHCVS